MDIKKWAGTKLGMGAPPGAAPPAPGGFPPPAGAAPGAPPPAGGPAGMYGPPSTPLFNPGITAASLPPTLAQWAQAGGTAPENPAGPLPGADPSACQHATTLVKKDWAAYPEPWAVVAMACDAMSGGGAAPGAPPGAPKPPGPPGPPKPPGGPPGAKPGFPPKPGGPPKPPGAV